MRVSIASNKVSDQRLDEAGVCEVRRVVQPWRVELVPGRARQQLTQLLVVGWRTSRAIMRGKEEQGLATCEAAKRAEGAAVVEQLRAAEEGGEVGAHERAVAVGVGAVCAQHSTVLHGSQLVGVIPFQRRAAPRCPSQACEYCAPAAARQRAKIVLPRWEKACRSKHHQPAHAITVADGKVGGDHSTETESDQVQGSITAGECVEELLELPHVVIQCHRSATAVRPPSSSHVVGEDAAAACLQARNERPPHIDTRARHAVNQHDNAFTLSEPLNVEVIACETVAAEHDLLVTNG